jgi:hypothetical protein
MSSRLTHLSNSSNIIFFGIKANVHVVVGDGGVQCNGGIDHFRLGPLTVRGVNGPRATFDLNLMSSEQSGKVNGVIDFLGVE